jgi:putative ABC transport system permease protein
MITHFFRLSWNRKRANALVLGELVVAFVVLCIVCTTLVYFVHNQRQPLGFAWHDVWRVRIDPGEYQGRSHADRNAMWERLVRLQQEARTLEGVESAALMINTPYSESSSTWSLVTPQGPIDLLFGTMDPQAVEVLRLQLVSGRAFNAEDVAVDWTPVLINQKLAQLLFGFGDPVGQSLPYFDDAGQRRERNAGETDYPIVGILQSYRRDGEVSATPYVAFQPLRTDGTQWPADRLVIRTRPGTTAEFEERLARRLHEIAPDWSFDVRTLESRRRDALRSRRMPLLIGGTAAAFLLIMVAMGLMGVVWLNVTRRTRELGLRRALGASAGGVRLQVMGELLALTSAAVGVGAIVFLQAPLLGIAGWVGWPMYGLGVLNSLVILYALVVVCGLYPSWLATRVPPARALHYE